MSEMKAIQTKSKGFGYPHHKSDMPPSAAQTGTSFNFLFARSLMSILEREQRPLLAPSGDSGGNTPPWLRPFFSLRIQLISVYSFLLALAVVCVCIFVYQQPSATYIGLIAISIVLFAIVMAFVLTTLLLRPLWRVTDAAQAIAVGDLKQRKRLPQRVPPQDEIDRLTGSLNEMVTRLEYAEEIQQTSELRFRRFFSDASHQLRTPLTSIRGFTEVLMRGAKDDPETAQRVLIRMKSEAERMTALINDLLTLARLDDTHSLKLQRLDLIEQATDSIEHTRVRNKNGCTILFKIVTQERLSIQADREQIKQLLHILLDNALKHGCTTPDDVITLQLGKDNGQIEIRVVDKGNGIAKEDLQHIFDSFYRGQHRSPNGPAVIGAGLGLTIAAAIVRAHHGTISASSDPGKGSEFIVTLPCMD